MLTEEGIELDIEENLDLFVDPVISTDRYAVKLLNHLRHNGIDNQTLQRKIKGQMKQADRLGANFTIVIGDQELENNKIDVKNNELANVKLIQLDALVEYFKIERALKYE
ncbi:His/Gly/Thr/Pro-type tRNA ligase C-terminal domain-containing protein [Staphylococcus aureus]